MKRAPDEEVHGPTVTLEAFAAGMLQGGRVAGMCNGSWGLPDLIARTLEVTGPADVTVCTFGLGISAVNRAAHAVRAGAATSFRFIVHKGLGTMRPESWAAMLRRIGRENFRLARVHAKFVIVANDAWKVAITTSGNMNHSKLVELFMWEAGPGDVFAMLEGFAVAQFDRGVIPEIPGASPSEPRSFGAPEAFDVGDLLGGFDV